MNDVAASFTGDATSLTLSITAAPVVLADALIFSSVSYTHLTLPTSDLV